MKFVEQARNKNQAQQAVKTHILAERSGWNHIKTRCLLKTRHMAGGVLSRLGKADAFP
ncbi:MAG: hypothetical protein JO117_03295 [Verrucomicrobia bacterium]|nr:hypothetical protein [Verrucomicrobiota bacterium]